MNFTMPWTAQNGHSNVDKVATATTEKLEDVRAALGREADHLAQVAAKMSREAGAHAENVASDVAHDAQKQTNVAMNRIADIAATLGPTIATFGRQKMREASEQAQNLGQDLRHVRITTEPKRNDALPAIAVIGGLGIGLGLGMAAAYLFDPERGALRRKVLSERLARLTRDTRAVAAEKANALRDTVTNGIGVPDEPLIAEELESTYETWPEGNRVPMA
jgi:gas vesicle protein